MVSAELTRLQERERFLERELQDAQANTDLSSARMDDETLTRLLGEEMARVLNAARESSHEIREKAEQAAAQMLMEASDEATRLREEAEIEASRRRADASNDAEAELSMAKQQGREMVNEARAYRERVLSELARRRELAREQIEQLVHGRDRLMQAFERARLVAVDVVAEMQPLGEPDEYVNLQPSTGPVPVMVAREAMAPAARTERATEDADAATAVVDLAGRDAEAPTAGDDAGHTIFDHEAEPDEPAPDDATATQAGPTDATVEGGVDGEHATGVEIDAGVEADDATGVDDAGVEADDATGADDAGVEADDATGADDATTESHGESADPDAGSVDDVVVDLFARIRATKDAHADAEDPADEDGIEADGAAAVDDAPVTDDSPSADLDGDVRSDDVLVASPFDRRAADLTPLIVASARKLKRVLADEQNEVLDALRRNDPVRDLDALLPWISHHAERYTAVIGEELHEAANAGAALTAMAGRTPRLRKAAASQAVQQANETLTRLLVSPLRDRLDRCIAEGDGDNQAITKRVRAVYREWKTQHIDEQLDDVFRSAHGRGVLAAVDVGAPLEWTPDPNHDVCPDCDDNRLAGAVPAGQAYPTGHVCTPAHPGCRCILVPAAR